MKCNKCWNELEPKTKSVASSCGHLFCLTCAEDLLGSGQGSSCPLCEAIITKSSVKIVTVLQEPRACQLSLCGQTPDTALNSALASVKFYIQQQELDASLLQSNLQSKMERVQEACKRKLQEVHNGYLSAKRKYQEMLEARNMLEADNEELKLKYQSKAQQTRKHVELSKQLQETCERLQQENEMLRRQGHGGQLARTPNLDPMGRPMMAGRPITPGRHGGHVVTTLEHKQVLLHPGQHQSPSTGLGSAGRPPSGLARNVSNDYARHSREQRMMPGGGGVNNLHLGTGNLNLGATDVGQFNGNRGMPGSRQQTAMQPQQNRKFLGGFPRSPSAFH